MAPRSSSASRLAGLRTRAVGAYSRECLPADAWLDIWQGLVCLHCPRKGEHSKRWRLPGPHSSRILDSGESSSFSACRQNAGNIKLPRPSARSQSRFTRVRCSLQEWERRNKPECDLGLFSHPAALLLEWSNHRKADFRERLRVSTVGNRSDLDAELWSFPLRRRFVSAFRASLRRRPQPCFPLE